MYTPAKVTSLCDGKHKQSLGVMVTILTANADNGILLNGDSYCGGWHIEMSMYRWAIINWLKTVQMLYKGAYKKNIDIPTWAREDLQSVYK